ncbi:hypothetical protein AKJ09_00427 [Labilithrix luteola]|uniref:Uncharacterized protein n=1 Tax=Labilithrix luteola TaxID=1391654 RepID=A0A0K1PJP9_9BACT|nr:hypothetical protein [Labilithrix luteola]AKU93763.1 hypothetical protein AKJ09_00427 [Labilithrix luteola]
MGLFELSAWIIACGLALAMIAAAEWGQATGRRQKARGDSVKHTRMDDAIIGLLGLLLGFTFASASAKYDQRLTFMVNEATAIANLATVGGLLDDPQRDELLREVRDYLDDRIEAPQHPRAAPERVELLRRTREHQKAMAETIRRVVHEPRLVSTHTSLIMALNAVMASYEVAQDGLRDHVPATVVLMLLVSATSTAFSLGRIYGLTGERVPFVTAVFIVLVALVVFVIFDLEQPRSGIVRIPVDSLLRVRSTLPL